MKSESLMALVCFSALVFASCDPIKKEPVNPQSIGSKNISFNAAPSDSWTYVDLETGKLTVAKDVNEWEYRQFIVENGEYKKKPDGTLDYNVTKTVKAGVPNAPATWHLAFHVYDTRINDGEALMTDVTELGQFTEMPKGNYVEDKNVFIAVDMSGMMQNVVGFSKASSNQELNKWLVSKGMPPKRTLSDKVFSVRFKDGSYALIQFKDYKDEKGKTKIVKFDYKFVKKEK